MRSPRPATLPDRATASGYLSPASALVIRRLQAADLFAIERQASQRMTYGTSAAEAMTTEIADAHVDQDEAWAAVAGGRVVACFGVVEIFLGRQGLAWAIFAEGLGSHHIRITRAARALIQRSKLARIDAHVACSDIEPLAAEFPQFDNWALVRAACAAPTPEMRWALAVGLKPAALLRRYGAASETVMLFERLGPMKELG